MRCYRLSAVNGDSSLTMVTKSRHTVVDTLHVILHAGGFYAWTAKVEPVDLDQAEYDEIRAKFQEEHLAELLAASIHPHSPEKAQT
jgi:hypothetical protein